MAGALVPSRYAAADGPRLHRRPVQPGVDGAEQLRRAAGAGSGAPARAVSGRLADKVARVMGAGQPPAETSGNGRATAVLMAREGARVVAVDLRREAAEETVAQIRGEGGDAGAEQADAQRGGGGGGRGS